MTHISAHQHDPLHDPSKTYVGFWAYLMSDCILFSILFATYAVLHDGTYGGPTSRQLFDLKFVLGETMFLLVSSFTCGLALLAGLKHRKKQLLFWFFLTFLCGASFVSMELMEFTRLVREGHTWETSAFLSSFFTLVATHGFHVSMGLLWMLVLLIPVIAGGLTPVRMQRLMCLRMFWHFLDVVWIFIFTFVYLMGVL